MATDVHCQGDFYADLCRHNFEVIVGLLVGDDVEVIVVARENFYRFRQKYQLVLAACLLPVVAQKELATLLLDILFGDFHDVGVGKPREASEDEKVTGLCFAAFEVESRDFIPVVGCDELTGGGAATGDMEALVG